MKRRSSLTRNRKLRCIFLLLILLILVTTFLCLRIDTTTDDGNDTLRPNNNPRLPRIAELDNAALAYIPRSVLETWGQREFLIVVGVPSVDNEERRRRRNLQRSTCWLFPGVATRANNFTGTMLVLYVFGRHPSHGYNYSAALQEEAAQWHDVVALPVNKGRVTTNKKIGEGDSWGDEAEVGMSRKTYFLFYFVLRLFPSVPFFARGDGDIFVRVPQFLADLRTLPRYGTYWGAPLTYWGITRTAYISGFCATLARDVVEAVVAYKPLRRLVRLPYSKDREGLYRFLLMQHEDAMVGRALQLSCKTDVIFYLEDTRRFHDVHHPLWLLPVTDSSVVLHHLWESEYEIFMRWLGSVTSSQPRKLRENIGWGNVCL